MQTFLPYPNFYTSASVLDNKRLGKQRVEAKQILLSLTQPTYGWKNHPAVKMWKGFENYLCTYGVAICDEWIRRGFKDSLRSFFSEYGYKFNCRRPFWFEDDRFHSSHRSNLLRKDPLFYGKFGWKEPNNLPYWWPVG